VTDEIPALERVGRSDVLIRDGAPDVLLVGVGAMVAPCVEVAEKLAAQGIGVTLVDPRWVKPVDPALVDLAADHCLVVTVEDNGRIGGCGATFAQALADAEVDTPVRVHGIPQEFLEHAKRAVILEQIGLNPTDLFRSVTDDLASLGQGLRLRDLPEPRGSATA
jgi:1-deoxy-D-xylulose-5-phosphate synthase